MPTSSAQRARAHAVTETMASIRVMAEALCPAVQAAAEAMAALGRALRQTTPAATAARRDRPAWATPYGPPPRRR
ncbi:hypothetical protein ACLQ2N_16435 [Streptomyces sp. DT224]|uniref:hypothetical protein n=1 Tax=Streptomyces sp. DT224 TaxID=3393426 RepID=UPI003CFAED91